MLKLCFTSIQLWISELLCTVSKSFNIIVKQTAQLGLLITPSRYHLDIIIFMNLDTDKNYIESFLKLLNSFKNA